MAALLKKRALAEFSQVIQEEAKPRPLKKLKLVHKPAPEPPQLDLSASLTSQEVLQRLLVLESQLPIDASHVDVLVGGLLDRLYSEGEGHVKAKLIQILGMLARTPGYDPAMLVNELSSVAKGEGSHKVLSQLLTTLELIGQTMSQDQRMVDQLLTVAKQNLKDGSHTVRARCLHLIGSLGSPDQSRLKADNQSEAKSGLQDLLSHYATDSDSRVREAAFVAMHQWHERGLKLEQKVYMDLCRALSDDYEGVRLIALRLVHAMAALYPESSVPVVNSEQENRLVDDAFACICHMVNDLSMSVRATAAGLLGSMKGVGPTFLQQTLDKKLMSHLRRKRSAHERMKEHVASGEWSSGQKWADDAPKEDLDPHTVSLISSGACGAFVHGLEDEFLEVRLAAMNSLCSLALQSPEFCQLSQDFLVDMFNDEIESVRLEAINCLCKMGHHVVLREDQLDTILSCLKDYSYDIRDALHEMMCSTQLATKSSLNSCMLGLLDNLRRYPQDRMSIWRCMRKMGQNHPSLVLTIVPELLSTHPYFDTPEPDVDDPAYIAVLILVFNAATDSPTLASLFPDYIDRHYTYIHDTLPDLVPAIKMPGMPMSDIKETVTAKPAPCFLDQTLKRLEVLPSMDLSAAQELIQLATRDLQRVQKVTAELAPTAECMSMFLQCQGCLAQIASSHMDFSPGLMSPQQMKQFKALLNKVTSLTQQMEVSFVGLSVGESLHLRQLQLLSQGLGLMIGQARGRSTLSRMCREFQAYLDTVERDLISSDTVPLTYIRTMIEQIEDLTSKEGAGYVRVVQAAMKGYKPTLLKLEQKLKKARVEIIEPTGESDNALRFTAGLVLGVNLVVDIHDVKDVANLRIKVKYPDQQIQLSVPRASHIREISDTHLRLSSQLLLSHAVWSDSCSVEVSVVLCYDPNRAVTVTEGESVEPTKSDIEQCYVELCDPVKVKIAPNQGKR